MWRLSLVFLVACASGGAGAPCARKSDCASGVCLANGCSSPTDASLDAAPSPDAPGGPIAPYVPDAAVDAPPD
ncbi:hypothetical protein BH11MYX1_BH11MYX1_10100 [soil metagenome]